MLHDFKNKQTSQQHLTQSTNIYASYLFPSKVPLPKLIQDLISVGPQLTERKFSLESTLVRALVLLLNSESLL